MLTGLRHLTLRIGPWPRRVLALGCLAMAAITALRAKPPAAAHPATTPVVVAVRDLPSGHHVRAADLQVRSWPVSARPAHAVAGPSTIVGRTLAGPIGRGDPLTPQRLLGPDLTSGLGRSVVATAVALDDPHAADLVHTGAYVDVIGTPREVADDPSAVPDGTDQAPSGTGRTLAQGVPVLAVLPATADDPTVELVVATDRATAARLAAEKVRTTFTVVARAP